MPEPVLMWTEARDTEAMHEALSDIIGAYERDFAKHPNVSEFPKISMIRKSVPSQLARENKKYIYRVVKEGARAGEYEDALQWLVDAGLLHKVYRSTAPGLPMSAYDDLSAFKIYPVDVGLLRKLRELFSDRVKLRVRFSLDNLKPDNDVLNIPLFMADQTDRLIGPALEEGVGR